MANGLCAAGDDVWYVDNRDPGCMSGDGRMATPVCALPGIIRAPQDLSGRQLVRVEAGATSYPSVIIRPEVAGVSNEFVLTLVSNGATLAPVAQDNLVGLRVERTGAVKPVVTVDGFDIQGNTGAGQNAVYCLGGLQADGGPPDRGALLTVLRSTLHYGHDGIAAHGDCDLVLDASVVANNRYTGVNANGTYAVSNALVYENGLYGMYMGGTRGGHVSFCTVVGNREGSASAASGIRNDGTVPLLVENSIVVLNGKGNGTNGVAGSQFWGNVVLHNVVTGMDTMAGAIQMAPVFVDRPLDDFELNGTDPANQACCFNKVSTTVDGGVPTLTDHDINGTRRPKGSGWDLGAYEVTE